MTETQVQSHFRQAFLDIMRETFEDVQGIYLDRETSLLETLATITAEEASQPVSANCASLAAHVAHVIFYMELVPRWVRGERIKIDWSHIWRTVQTVTPEEWAASQDQLRQSYEAICAWAQELAWEHEDDFGGALGLVAHNAYHLGEIRQALCTLRPGH